MPRDGSSKASDAVWRDISATLAVVFSRPSRIKRMLALGPRGWWWTARFLIGVVPQASRRLLVIRERAAKIPDTRLREQALCSIDEKAYHVQGGCILATFLPHAEALRLIDIVTFLETIYDYLDNLCDRLPDVPSAAYPVLHEALRDALDPARAIADYYRAGPLLDDGGYLRWLVEQTRAGIARLPNYGSVATFCQTSVRLYTDLQHFKHLPSPQREDRCETWYASYAGRFPDLAWWEFAAACGSSLPVFALLYAASRQVRGPAEIEQIDRAYFPSVSAVHILLDYFIDQAEDREHSELNFIDCYPSLESAVRRLRQLVQRAAADVRALPNGARHLFALQAMCTFYLTHPKVFSQRLETQSNAVLDALSLRGLS